jgi:hypothetical protein
MVLMGRGVRALRARAGVSAGVGILLWAGCALSVGWTELARAETSSRVPPQPLPAPGTSSAPPAEAPLELDLPLSGGTQAERRLPDASRSRFEGLVLLSAADGVGGGGQMRSGPFGLRATVAYQPLLFLVDADPADKTFGAFEFSNSFQLNVDAMLLSTDTETGGSLGYRFNDLLGHGISVAYQSAFDAWGQHFSLSFPVTYYPSATERVRDQLDIASGYEINFPFGAGLQFGMGAAWIL